MGDSTSFRSRVTEQGPVDVSRRPDVAWVRFWTQGWRFHGRASRTEFFWVIALQAVVTLVVWWLVEQLGMTARWTVYADPFGIVPSPQVGFHLFEIHQGRYSAAWWGYGSGRDAWPDSWDVAIIVGLLVTAIPRWSLLVRRLHDRDHTGMWILLLVFTGPIGWLVVTGMVVSRPRVRGARFDRGLFAGRRESVPDPDPGPTLTQQV
jgi:uncharacterized membrane protein YhaH (DUF805 family)